MNKPQVRDPDLQNLVDQLYRAGARIGTGGAADAIRFERETGQRAGGRSHVRKARDGIRALQRWLRRHPYAHPDDRAAAEALIRDRREALRS